MISFNRDEPDEYVYHMRTVYLAALRKNIELACDLTRKLRGQKSPLNPKVKQQIIQTAQEWTRRSTPY